MLSTIIAVGIWSSVGVLIALIAKRNGHNLLTFLGLGIAYGPFVVIFLADQNRFGRPPTTVLQAPGPVTHGGWLSVLVGLDGSPESLQSADEVVALLGPSIKRLCLALVLEPEVASKPDRFAHDDEATNHLFHAAEQFGFGDAEIVLINGRADQALVNYAVENNMDLLVVAHRQHRASAVLVGSTVARLARNADIPVLIGPPPTSKPAASPQELLAAKPDLSAGPWRAAWKASLS